MSQFEEDTATANKLFVEAVRLVEQAEERVTPEPKYRALDQALFKLNMIINNYPATDLAVKLISGQDTGSISLVDITKKAERARKRAERTQKEEERAAEEARKEEEERSELERPFKAAERGDAVAQYRLGDMYEKGSGVPKNHAKAIEWYRMAAEQGYAIAKRRLKKLETLNDPEKS